MHIVVNGTHQGCRQTDEHRFYRFRSCHAQIINDILIKAERGVRLTLKFDDDQKKGACGVLSHWRPEYVSLKRGQ